MLALAISLAIIGFAVLVFALWQGSMALAWICIGIASVGVVLSLVDLARHRKRSRETTTSDEGRS
ncbi:membrane protein [Corynebacterium auriscanis]|uniref:Membrane protein n=1 Tax=Corynebacterium auriscanis TaxID=99807 RepID=A0A0A2DIZ6_9CORY|nr:membrane protein [Corynebacterium auriscanis]